MRCSNCREENTWLEKIGSDFICSKCIQKHRLMGMVFRTSSEAFRRILRKLKPLSYLEYMAITEEQITSRLNLKDFGVSLKR